MPDLYSSNKQTKTDSPKQEPIKPVVEKIEKKEEPMITKTQKLADPRVFVPQKSGNSFSALLFRPSNNIRFQTQEQEEEILMILRAHVVVNIPWILLSIIIFLAPAVLRFFPLLDSFPLRFRFIFVIVWYLILLMFMFEQFLSWFFNMTIITDERIIDVDFLNLTTKKVSDADLDKIQDVTYTNSGGVGTIFNYGNVTVQTAAEISEFVFNNVPNPGKVADILQHLRIEEKVEAAEGRIR